MIATIVAFEAVSDRNQVQTDKTTSAIISTQTLLRALLDAETGVRGYIATGQPLFLQPHESAVTEVPVEMQALDDAVKNGLLTAASARNIDRRAFRVLDLLEQEVTLASSNHRDAALHDLTSGREKGAMDAVRDAIGAQIAIWRADRAKAAASLHEVRVVLYGITIAGSLAVIGGLLSSLWFFGFGLIRRIDTLSDNSARVALGEPLLDQMPGNDELAQLDRALHAMSRVINEREAVMARFRLIFEAAHDAITFIDVQSGRVVEANPAACHLYGYEHREIIGAPLALLRAPEFRDALEKQLTDALTGGVSTEAVALRKDGSTVPMESSLHGTVIEGRPVVVSIIRDATERRQTRQQLLSALDDAVRASRLKSEFVAGISHEIRTPMNGVVGMTDLLLQTALDEQQRDFAETIRDSADALLRIIGDILDFSKIEAGKVEIESAAFDIRRIVESTATILGANAARKPIGLMTFIDPRLPSLVTGDAGRLRQILLNLVGNAIKFTQTGCVTLSVEPAGEQLIRFSVVDTGMGMTPETIERLFKPFTQADASTTRRYGGTGLGLSISLRLVELMGGKLEVASELGTGSRFWFTIPLTLVSEGDGVIALRGKRCAIVIADRPTRTMLQRYALSWQMQSVAAESWNAASFNGTFDIAIVDAAGRPMAEDRDVHRIITVIDGEPSSSTLQGGNTIVRAPLT
ncbi:MAG: ATP-binding protein, partial [Vulcanimicrobiaceae bacterium]